MKRIALITLALCLAVVLFSCGDGNAEAGKQYAVPGKVTLVDLGAGRCIPCQMMAPILQELKQTYQGKAEIVFLDVWEDKTPAVALGVRVIPTQIFYDRDGKEVLRHEGFLDRAAIVAQLEKMGVPK